MRVKKKEREQSDKLNLNRKRKLTETVPTCFVPSTHCLPLTHKYAHTHTHTNLFTNYFMPSASVPLTRWEHHSGGKSWACILDLLVGTTSAPQLTASHISWQSDSSKRCNAVGLVKTMKWKPFSVFSGTIRQATSQCVNTVNKHPDLSSPEIVTGSDVIVSEQSKRKKGCEQWTPPRLSRQRREPPTEPDEQRVQRKKTSTSYTCLFGERGWDVLPGNTTVMTVISTNVYTRMKWMTAAHVRAVTGSYFVMSLSRGQELIIFSERSRYLKKTSFIMSRSLENETVGVRKQYAVSSNEFVISGDNWGRRC